MNMRMEANKLSEANPMLTEFTRVKSSFHCCVTPDLAQKLGEEVMHDSRDPIYLFKNKISH